MSNTYYLDDNVTQIPINTSSNIGLPRDIPAMAASAAGSPEDPRMKEALRLLEAFLAIEDPAARAAIITLADRLVTQDWLRKVKQR
jgi:hypothetical protein